MAHFAGSCRRMSLRRSALVSAQERGQIGGNHNL
jgi:hypothetical protein